MSRTGEFFIVMRTDLADEAEVIALADKMNVREEVIVGYLHAVWSWIAHRTDDGVVHGVSLASLGRRLKLDDFPQKMAEVGWLTECRLDDGQPTVTIPNFDRWLDGKAARRQHEAQKKAVHREKKHVLRMSPSCPGQKLPTGTGTAITTSAENRPILSEIVAYAECRNSTVDPREFFEHYEHRNWVGKKGSPVKDWRRRFRDWETRQQDSAEGKNRNRNSRREVTEEVWEVMGPRRRRK